MLFCNHHQNVYCYLPWREEEKTGEDEILITVFFCLQRNGEKKEAVGDAYIPDPKYPSRLGVRFSNRKFSTLLYKNIDKIIIFSAIIRSFNR